MPTGRVKIFHDDRHFGFITSSDGRDVFVGADAVSGGSLRSGDAVEFDLDSGDQPGGGARAVSVKVTKPAPQDNPIGRTMSPPPSWDELEEVDRQRRAARRRRR